MTGVSPTSMHGALAAEGWRAPKLVRFCDEAARPKLTDIKAHEFEDDEETLRAKIKVLATLVSKAKHFVVYTGAGLSTASGIADYASKAKDSVAKRRSGGKREEEEGEEAKDGTPATTSAAPPEKAAKPAKPVTLKMMSHLEYEPTYSHYALTALHKHGILKHWLQQNHDGLATKAGFPISHLNEIHGSWWDPSNTVVPMSGTLRRDLGEWMWKERDAADFVLALGTSLSGMNSDSMVSAVNRRARVHNKGLGAVIVGLQQTRMDSDSSLRIFGRTDHVMRLLMEELRIDVPIKPYTMTIPEEARVEGEPDSYMVPYDAQGYPVASGKRRKWKLASCNKVRITCGPGENFKGVVFAVEEGGACPYTVVTRIMREGTKKHGTKRYPYAVGGWVIEAACRGQLSRLPFVNVYF